MNYTERNNTNRLYTIWVEARRRANNPRQASYKNKNLEFHSKWNEYMSFREWALTNGYSSELTLDRRDNNLGYTPDNCRWATKREQAYNRAKTSENVTSKYIGVSKQILTGRQKSLAKMWRVRVTLHGKQKTLPNCTTELEAAKARDAFCRQHNLNVVYNFK